MNHQHQFASPLGRDLFAMFSVPPTQAELHEALRDVPFAPLSEADVDGLCHSFSGRPVTLPCFPKKEIDAEWANLEHMRKREHRGAPHEL